MTDETRTDAIEPAGDTITVRRYDLKHPVTVSVASSPAIAGVAEEMQGLTFTQFSRANRQRCESPDMRRSTLLSPDVRIEVTREIEKRYAKWECIQNQPITVSRDWATGVRLRQRR